MWVAETMLQQTRIAVVVPAYERFLSHFPTLGSLAAASEDDVLSLWSGLGYYSRARNLRRAAIQLVNEKVREFPRDMAGARALPGVGAYTAAAVLSIAYGEAHAAIDGNVIRVLSRLARLLRPDPRGQPHADLAAELLDRRHAGDWNQALMELGETICTPKVPLCGQCPVADCCMALRHGDVNLYPPPKPRRERDRLTVAFRVVGDREGRVVLERGAFPYLRHLWLPILTPRLSEDAGATFRHAILHRDFTVRVASETVSPQRLRRLAGARRGGERSIFSATELSGIGRSSLLTKALRLSASHPKEGKSRA